MKCHPLLVLLGLLLLALPALADETTMRLKDKAEELQNQAKRLEQLGRKEEAKITQQQAIVILQEIAAREAAAVNAERPRRSGSILERQITELRARYFDLRNRGQAEQADRVREEMNTLLDRAAEKRRSEAEAMRAQAERIRAGGADDPRGKKIDQLIDEQEREVTRLRGLLEREPDPTELATVGLTRRQRRTHLLEAAAHLRAAGRPELADDLTAEATELTRAETVEAPRPVAEPGSPTPVEVDLRKELEALRREVQDLRARVATPAVPR